MSVKNILLMGIAPQLIAALALQARQTVDCDFAIAANSGDTCATFAASWGLTETAFAAINPTVSCPGDLDASEDYCVIGSVTGGTTTTSTTTTAKTTSTTKATTTTTTTAKVTTTTSTTSTTPVTTTTSSSQYEPTQSGLAADCDSFHLVATGDTCSTIESQAGISAADFASWNPTIDSTCSNLWLDYYVCVGVPGAATATTTTTSTASATATTTGPTPQMPSIVSTCNDYYQVQSDDGCYSIEQAEDITSAEFLAWNPYVDSACDNLWLGYYVCVGV